MKPKIYFAKHFRYLAIVLCILLNGYSHQAKAQLVLVPDANFRAALIAKGFGSCFTGNYIDSTCALVSGCTTLNVVQKNISDLTGIEAFVNLTALFCDKNNLISLPLLPNILATLSCSNNQLANLQTLPNTLTYIDCSFNILSVLPSFSNSLITLFCDNNQLANLPPLPNSLTTLRCNENQLTNLPTLPNSLIELNCEYNQLTNLPTLPNSLNKLVCINNQLANLPTLPNSLTQLYCGYNQFTNLPALPNSLNLLNCEYNRLSNLPSLPSSLIRIYCNDDQLTNLPTLPYSLTELYCNYNQLANLPTLPNSLTILACHENLLTYLPALPNSLTRIYCNDNQLANLPTLPNSLTQLNCEYNHLTNLPSLPNSLTQLFCNNNQLANLPTLPNSLTFLGCDSNQLTKLPTLPNSITGLFCFNNPYLSCLPDLKNVTTLYFYGTGISCLPNYGHVTLSDPALNTVPLCGFYNPFGCDSYWNISGKTYFDSDTNCVFNNGDFNESNFKLNLYKSGNLKQQAFTGSEGYYSFDTDSLGIYKTVLDTTDIPFIVRCPASLSFVDTLVVNDTLKYDRNFSLKCKSGFDLAATSIYGQGFIPGHSVPVHIYAGDFSNKFGAHCASGVGGTVSIIFSGAVNYVSPMTGALTPSLISGDTLTYSIADFGTVDFDNSFNFILNVDTLATIGTQVCISVAISPAIDNNPTNNFISQCYTVRGSFDPNEKTVSPEGSLDINGDRWLTYTVSFQNTGTAPAEHIYITDTLDTNLDLSTFQLLAYSHSPYVQILNGGIAKFNFKNINLPDSVSNEPASHGYVQYKIKAKNNLANNVQISNTAYIYFDFNTPVVTNTVTNTILNCQQSAGLVTQIQDTLFSTISGATYQWINCTSGNIISGATAQSFVPTSSGNYAVIVSSGTCTDTSSCHYISLTGISKNFTSDISVSPNPSNDEFVVNCPQNIIGNNLSLKVFDTYGKLIEQKQIVTDNTILNATNWSQGIYFLELNIFGNTTVKKLVKE